MKNKQTTLSLKASQAIASLGIECESEKWWENIGTNSILTGFDESHWQLTLKKDLIPSNESFLAPNLQELLALLPAIGEKIGIKPSIKFAIARVDKPPIVTKLSNDWEKIMLLYSWELTPKGYIRGKKRNSSDRKIFLHRIITGAQEKEYVDHINGDKTDNRVENLRLVTLQENALNKKNTPNGKYRGVYFRKEKNKYQVKVMYQKVSYSGGYYKDKDEARIQAEVLRRKLFGKWHNPDPVRDWNERVAHNLLDTYLTNYDMRNVSAEIIKLINNK